MSILKKFVTGYSAATGRSILLLVLAASSLAHAQPERRAPAPTLSEQRVTQALAWLVSHAPIILSGEVLTAPAGNAAAFQPIAFVRIRVDQALRGVQAGEIFRFGQWHGAGELEFLPHERVILFLHRANAAGLASSVAGSFGVLRIGGGAMVDVRALEMFSAQRCITPVRFGVEVDRNVADALPGRRKAFTPGPRLAAAVGENPNALPEWQISATIAALLREQDSAPLGPLRKEAADVR